MGSLTHRNGELTHSYVSLTGYRVDLVLRVSSYSYAWESSFLKKGKHVTAFPRNRGALTRPPPPEHRSAATWALLLLQQASRTSRARPSTSTAGCLDRPSFGAIVDHQTGACGSAQQRRDQLHHERARETQAQICRPRTLELTATRARSIGREHRWCFIGPLRAAARRWSRGRAAGCRQPVEYFGVSGLAAGVVAGGAACDPWKQPVGSGGPVHGGGQLGSELAFIHCSQVGGLPFYLSPAPPSAGTQASQGALRAALQAGGLKIKSRCSLALCAHAYTECDGPDRLHARNMHQRPIRPQCCNAPGGSCRL